MVDWTFLVPRIVDRKLMILLLVIMGVGVGSGTFDVLTGLLSWYRGIRDLSIFAGASVYYVIALLMYGWRRMLKKYYRPPPSDDRSTSGAD